MASPSVVDSEATGPGKVRRLAVRRGTVIALAVLALALVCIMGIGWFASPRPVGPESLIREVVARNKGVFVSLSKVAPVMRAAVVDAEDERFWRHHGIDMIGVARAFAYDVTHLTLHQGASTITEQLAKVLYLGGNDHSPWRKLEDAAIALRLEGMLSKDQILEGYLNTAYFGDGATGVGRASEQYFGVPPSRLSLSQASLLAGLVQAPSADNPYRSPEAARQRQEQVLRSMIRNGDITVDEAPRALTSPLRLADGTVLPGAQSVNLSAGPQLSTPELALGLCLVVLGASSFALHGRLRRRVPFPWWTIATLVEIAGVLFFVGSLRMD
jgi:Transglycosylase